MLVFEQCKAGVHFVGSALKLAEHLEGGIGVWRFAEDAAVYCYNGVGAEDEGLFRIVPEALYGGFCFFFCYPPDIAFNALFGVNMLRSFKADGGEGDATQPENLFCVLAIGMQV